MGGDGTVGDVANGLIGSDVELGIIPVGTGNDIARSLGLPPSPEGALKSALQGEARKVDVGQDGETCFLSVLGIGFPADVAEFANNQTFWQGSAAFFFAVYHSVQKMRAFPVEIELDKLTIRERCSSIMIQNTRYTGGGLKIAPSAEMDDGYLDIVVVGDIGKMDFMFNFPRVYLGNHLSHKAFSAYRSRTVKIVSEVPLRKIFDGDIKGATPVDARILPGALSIVVQKS
jgi:YegS/Rv2252/BmrU family lipid kinase